MKHSPVSTTPEDREDDDSDDTSLQGQARRRRRGLGVPLGHPPPPPPPATTPSSTAYHDNTGDGWRGGSGVSSDLAPPGWEGRLRIRGRPSRNKHTHCFVSWLLSVLVGPFHPTSTLLVRLHTTVSQTHRHKSSHQTHRQQQQQQQAGVQKLGHSALGLSEGRARGHFGRNLNPTPAIEGWSQHGEGVVNESTNLFLFE